MIELVLTHVGVLAFIAVFALVPGWVIGRLLEVQLAIPDIALVPVWFVLSLGLWTLALVPSLASGWPWFVTSMLYVSATAVLFAWERIRHARRGTARAAQTRSSTWALAGIALCVALAAAFRTRMAFDTIFHLGLVRRLLELPHPRFDDLDRIVGSGVNPAYLVPVWQAMLASIAGVLRVDPAVVVEATAGFGALLAACAAAALGRVVTNRAAGEVAAVAAYAWMRIWFPRRELEGDGIAYGAMPGNLTLDVLLPVLLMLVLLLVLRTDGVFRRWSVRIVAAVTMVLLLLMHANYVEYVAVIGVGMLGWLAAVGPFTAGIRRRVLDAAASVTVPGLVTLAVLLPFLTMIDHFAKPIEQRITYHVVGHGAWTIIRPGHFYDGFGMPGLLALLLLPIAVACSRGVVQALIGGGALALLAFGEVPPLYRLLSSSGSMTLGLRLPRPFGVILVAGVAVALPVVVEHVRRRAAATAVKRGALLGHVVRWLPIAAVLVLSLAYGYPLARREPAQYGWNWPTIVAAGALVGMFVAAVVQRIRRARDPEQHDVRLVAERRVMRITEPMAASVATGLAVLAIGAALLPSGYWSLRRGAWQARELVSSTRADDLACVSGIRASLARVPAGSVIVADPVSSYDLQAMSPARIVADYKTWNGRTDSKDVNDRIELLDEAFDSSDPDAAARALRRLTARFHTRWVVTAAGAVEPPLGSELRAYDARGLRQALGSTALPATRVAHGEGRGRSVATDDERAACNLTLWRLS